jgi:hypothetical protein
VIRGCNCEMIISLQLGGDSDARNPFFVSHRIVRSPLCIIVGGLKRDLSTFDRIKTISVIEYCKSVSRHEVLP